MAWSSIAASETDANSPLNQTLLDKVRGNLDYLHSSGANTKFVTGYDTTASTSRDIVIDNTIDYRNRLVIITGILFNNTALNIPKYVPGGTSDQTINNQTGHVVSNAKMFFAESGSASGAADPRLTLGAGGGFTSVNVYADSDITGALALDVVLAAQVGVAWNLMITYSEVLI